MACSLNLHNNDDDDEDGSGEIYAAKKSENVNIG